MITHVLTNGDAILEIEVSDNKDTINYPRAIKTREFGVTQTHS